MIANIYEELKPMQERMYRKSKKQFREYLFHKATACGRNASIYPETKLSKNVVVGNLKDAKIVLCAHYDTPPRLPVFFARHTLVLNILLGLVFLAALLLDIWIRRPFFIGVASIVFLYVLGFLGFANKKNFNDNTSGVLALLLMMEEIKTDQVAFVFFDNEEKGLIGSLDLIRAMKKDKIFFSRKKFIVFDCIGRGKHIGLAGFKDTDLPSKILDSFEPTDAYHVFSKKGSLLEISDHYSFQFFDHCGIFAFDQVKKKDKYVLRDIHSRKDSEIDLMNVLYIVESIKKYTYKELSR